MRGAFARTLAELAERDPRILLLTGDLGYMALEPFAEKFPERFFNMGVAEQNMVGVATGLAEAGFIPFVYSIVSFAVLDLNGQQALGYTKEVLSLDPMAARWRAFGWDVHEVDGHDLAQLRETFARLDTSSGPPHVLIAHTVFGKGVSYMESQIKWHYSPMSDAEYDQAIQELEAAQ